MIRAGVGEALLALNPSLGREVGDMAAQRPRADGTLSCGPSRHRTEQPATNLDLLSYTDAEVLGDRSPPCA